MHHHQRRAFAVAAVAVLSALSALTAFTAPCALASLATASARGTPAASPPPRLPQHVVVVFLDGPRFSETWASPQHIPWLSGALAPHGAVLTGFYNQGTTKTVSGHASVITGTWQHLRNDGSEWPHAPTLFELLRAQQQVSASRLWIVAGKDKIRALSHSDAPGFGPRFAACDSVDLGPDTQTCAVLRGVLQEHAPRLSMANFGDIDRAGHDERWELYLARITRADSLLGVLWDAIESDPRMQGTTTLFVTYDHGRHDDRPQQPHGGFKDHGDDCAGCRHIALYARGCGIRTGVVSAQDRDMCDLGATVAWMLGLSTSTMTGTPIVEILAPDLSGTAPPAGMAPPAAPVRGHSR